MTNQHHVAVQRYSPNELNEFKTLIEKKIEIANQQLTFYKSLMQQTSRVSYEDNEEHTTKETAATFAAREQKMIDLLQKALVRIENGTYGICVVTGRLISKSRLKAAPHTTHSVEGKMLVNS